MAVGVFEFSGYEFDVIVHYGGESRLDNFFHLHEPLHGQFGFYHRIRALGVSNLVDVVFHFFDESCLVEINHDLFSDIETVHADIHSTGFGYCAVVIEYVN